MLLLKLPRVFGDAYGKVESSVLVMLWSPLMLLLLSVCVGVVVCRCGFSLLLRLMLFTLRFVGRCLWLMSLLLNLLLVMVSVTRAVVVGESASWMFFIVRDNVCVVVVGALVNDSVIICFALLRVMRF